MRGEGKYWLLLALVVVGTVVFEVLRPRALDWTPTLVPGDARPYGAEVLRHVLPGLAQGAVNESYRPLRTLLQEADEQTLLILADEARLSPFDVERLLTFVEEGGTVVLAAHRLPKAFDDTLGISTWGGVFEMLNNPFSEEADTSTVRFTAPGLDRALHISGALVPGTMRFRDEDTTRWAAQPAALARDDEGQPLALRFVSGEGAFIYTNAPLLLSNFGLLNSEGEAFAERLFAYVPPGPMVWWRRGAGEAATPLRYVLEQDSLRWSLYTALFGVVLFMVMAARRRERPVPTVEPPRNDTLDFVRTIGLLYFNRGDHANLAAKLRHQFFAFVRDTLGIALSPADPAFAARIAQRSGVPLVDVQAVLDAVRRSETDTHLSQHELLALGRILNGFYRASIRGRSEVGTRKSNVGG